jgi:hypothetical protein
MGFTAILVVCAMQPGVPDDDQMCIVLTDDRGPYTTEARCTERVHEMQSTPNLPQMMAAQFATIGYHGGLQVRGGCKSEGRPA